MYCPQFKEVSVLVIWGRLPGWEMHWWKYDMKWNCVAFGIRRCRRWGHSGVHWRRNCSADHTATQTIGHSSIDITAVVWYVTHSSPEVLFQVAMKFMDDDDDDGGDDVDVVGDSTVDGKPEWTNQWCYVLRLSWRNHWEVKGQWAPALKYSAFLYYYCMILLLLWCSYQRFCFTWHTMLNCFPLGWSQ